MKYYLILRKDKCMIRQAILVKEIQLNIIKLIVKVVSIKRTFLTNFEDSIKEETEDPAISKIFSKIYSEEVSILMKQTAREEILSQAP